MADAQKQYKSNEPDKDEFDEADPHKKLIGGSNMTVEHQRIVGSQDMMRPARALLVDLEIS